MLTRFKQSLLPIHQEKHYIISEMEVSAQALSIIDKVTKLQVDVRINSQQCKRLVDRFEYIGQSITKWDSIHSAGGDEQPLQAWDGGEVQVSRNFDQLLVVLKKGEALVVECSGQDLRTKVFLNTDNRHAFEEIHRDIDTCASFLHMDDLSSLRKGSDFCTMTEEERASCLTTDAGQDLAEILQSGLETMNGSWEGPHEGAEKLMNAVKHKIKRGRYDQESNGVPDGVFMDASDMKITRALCKGADTIISEVDWLGCKLAAKDYFFVLYEVKQLSKLRHPHVVQIVGYSKIEDSDVMIMELMDGNLEDLIKDCMQKNGSSNSGPFSQEVTLDILYQIARGMQYLHHQGLGHGRLKCSNVLVRTHNSDSIEVKVADFGYATKVSKGVMERTFSGVETIGQMDVLDFAQIWCAIASGILPPDDNCDWSNRISFGEHGPQFAIPSERLSPEVEGLVKACLNSVARERPTFEEICHLLDHIRAPKPTYLEPQKSPAWSLKGMFENVLNKVTNLWRHKPLIKCNLEPMPHLSEADEAQQVCVDLPSYLRIRQSCITLLGEIGQGASATVYEAEWMGVKFAVKSICAEMHSIQLQREVGVWIKLRHPRIVQLMGFSVAKNSSLIVMELLGGDLRKLIDTRMASMKEGGPFMRREALDVMVQIAEGMAYLHKQGIMHRDLKSLNVLVVGQSRPIQVKIADFGISKYINTPSERGAVGTGFWRAPEVLSALRDGITQPSYTSKADVYSYGMTCYEVLTGLIPFDGHPRADYSLVLSGNRPQLPEYVSDDVAELITRCWHQEPEQRPEFLDICHKLRSLMKAT